MWVEGAAPTPGQRGRRLFEPVRSIWLPTTTLLVGSNVIVGVALAALGSVACAPHGPSVSAVCTACVATAWVGEWMLLSHARALEERALRMSTEEIEDRRAGPSLGLLSLPAPLVTAACLVLVRVLQQLASYFMINLYIDVIEQL